MAAIPAAHFLHPKHVLKLREEYHLSHSCDLCGEKLTGSGYSCQRRLCGFDLHEECAKYPETLGSFFAHPSHDLTLARTDARRLCDLCREEVPAGVFVYRCAPCGFDVHPRCSRLPRTARSDELHPEHGLSLMAMPSAGAPCAACREPCGVWVYRCGPCDVDLHIECLHGARSSGGENRKWWSSALALIGEAVLEGVVEGVVESLAEVAVQEEPKDEEQDPDYEECPEEDLPGATSIPLYVAPIRHIA